MHFWCFLTLSFLLDSSNSRFFNIPSSDGKMRVRASKELQPWLGVLEVRDKSNLIDAITSTILIAANWSIANARDIAGINKPTIIKRSTVSFFIKKRFALECAVLQYIIHPEFNHETVNTLALIKLQSKLNVSWPIWKPVSYPKSRYKLQKDFYFVGFTENEQRLEQRIQKMRPVNKNDCKNFYKRTGLDVKTFWPVYYKCFKSLRKSESCIYDAGSAVAVKNEDDWELVGLSTYGPGCDLPSRFIEIYPYIKWIDLYTETLKKKITYSRRFDWDLGPIEEGFERKLYVLLTDEKITVYLDASINEIKLQEGRCGQDSEVVYTERDKFKGTYSVYYALTVFDQVVKNFTCITSEVDSLRRSRAHLIVQKGFGELVDIQRFVKKIQLDDRLEEFRYRYEVYTIPVRYDTLKNATEHNTYTIWFNFVVSAVGEMVVRYYAKMKPEYAYG